MKVISRLRDNLRFFLNSRRYAFKPQGLPQEFAFAKLKHLLIAKMDGKLGDSQVITAFIANLRVQLPELQISVICTENVAPAFRDALSLHTVVIPKKAKPHEVERVVLADELFKAQPCDAVLTTEPNFRARDFCLNYLLKPQYLIGIEERSGTVNINLKEQSFGRHISQYFEDLLLRGGLEVKVKDYLPIFTAADKEKAECVLPRPCFGIAPYGASVHRRLSDETVVEIVSWLTASTNFRPALLFKPSAELLQKCEEAAGERLLQIPGNTSICEFAAMVAACTAVLSVDSAPVHLANGARVPALCLYSGHDLEGIKRWGPAPFAAECQIYYKQGAAIEELCFEDFKPALFDFLQTSFKNGLR